MTITDIVDNINKYNVIYILIYIDLGLKIIINHDTLCVITTILLRMYDILNIY